MPALLRSIPQYIRESGSPSAQTSEVTLENEGEIRISNINLQDADFELSGSTQIYLNGSAVLSPFQVPYGGYAVFPLSAGTHYLEVTLRGKPGGGLEVAFYENKPDAPVQGKGWELLDDGTVLHRKTGLIWHRKMGSPGIPRDERGNPDYYPKADDSTRTYGITISDYIKNLNEGVYGEDKIVGNAGYSDWRAPTMNELLTTSDSRAIPPFADANGEVIPSETHGTLYAGMKPGEPLIFCITPIYYEASYTPGTPLCPDDWYVETLITNQRVPINFGFGAPATIPNWFQSLDLYSFHFLNPFNSDGDVWPVRGGQPD